MPPPEPPSCRTCGRPLAPNARGDYVDCCSRLVRPPAPRRETHGALRWWGDAVDSTLTRAGAYLATTTPGARALLLFAAFLVGVALVCAALRLR